MADFTIYPEKEPSKAARGLAEQVERDGGRVLAVYQEPVGEHWQIFCLLPRAKVEASPYQRDVSPTHAKRLTEAVRRVDRFVDPIVVVSARAGVYWTPNGNHRRVVLEKLKAEFVPAILVAEPNVAFQVLALNTEKAHNLKEKSLEVIRMYRGAEAEQPTSTEEDWAFQFESAHLITLGLLYEQNKRFAGGAFAPILRRVDKFLKTSLRKGLEAREERVVLVTGGSGALGQAITRRFLAEGAVVCVPWIVEQERERLEASVESTARKRLMLERCDVADDAAMARLAEALLARQGRIDVLVSAVGGFAMGDLVHTDRKLWDSMLTLNLTTAYVAAHAVVPPMLAAGAGRIVAVASRAVVPPAGGFIAYTVAKAAVIAFVQALAVETRGRGVTVNAVLPSTMDTPANRAAMPDVDPKTWVPVASVADAIAYLAAESSGHVTGTLLAI